MRVRTKEAELSPGVGENATVFLQDPSWGGRVIS